MIRRANVHAQESGVEISRIKELLQKIKFEVNINLIRGNDDTTDQNIQPLKLLSKECDEKAGEARMNAERFEAIINMKYYGKYVIIKDEVIMSRNI